jgi:hypothetical protein
VGVFTTPQYPLEVVSNGFLCNTCISIYEFNLIMCTDSDKNKNTAKRRGARHDPTADNPSTQRLKQEDQELEASLSYTVRPSQGKQKKKKKEKE